MRGEKPSLLPDLNRCNGSSPRAWGKVYCCLGEPDDFRIIPTCVGKRRPRRTWIACSPDHPHVRGEKTRFRTHKSITRGSSPRAWGKGNTARPETGNGRIIPTCVGKSIPYAVGSTFMPDHPHVRGEKETLNLVMDYAAGSSPRAWGKGPAENGGVAGARIIPTCVGKSPMPWRCLSIPSDHPHVRGEKRSRRWLALRTLGSSPRAWGKECIQQFTSRTRWIIPTCVGKSPPPRSASPSAPDHPHVRGEKENRMISLLVIVGSSPRAWGKVSPG